MLESVYHVVFPDRVTDAPPFEPAAGIPCPVRAADDVPVNQQPGQGGRHAKGVQPEGGPHIHEQNTPVYDRRPDQVDEVGTAVPVKRRARRKRVVFPIETGHAAPVYNSRAEIVSIAPDLDIGQPGPFADVVLDAALAFGGQIVVHGLFNRLFESLLVPDEVDNIAPILRVQSRPLLL